MNHGEKITVKGKDGKKFNALEELADRVKKVTQKKKTKDKKEKETKDE